jgi:2-desacetyl-2-hydroxyethyl bacteriochlorophyllide A dehydrogenase
MKAAVLHAVGDIRFEDVPTPEIEDNEVLLRVKACGVCGTDVHFFHGEWVVDLPLIPGHEFSGELAEVGKDVTVASPGDKVSIDPNVICNVCKSCRRTDKSHLCSNIKAIGVDTNGAFAEYLKAPESAVYHLPDNVDFETGAMTEPVGCAIRGFDNTKTTLGDNVVIIGAGPIGLILQQMALLQGAAKVLTIELIEERRKMAEKLGAHRTISPAEEDVSAAVAEETQGNGPEVVFEAVGSAKTIELALDLAGRGARVNLFGVAPQSDVINVRPFMLYDKELKISASYRDPFTFDRAIQLLANDRIDVKSLITHRYPLSEIREAFETFEKKKAESIKIMMLP